MAKKKRNRQAGSLKLWVNEKTGTYWNSVLVHKGRTTVTVNGPEAVEPEISVVLLNEQVRGRKAKVQ